MVLLPRFSIVQIALSSLAIQLADVRAAPHQHRRSLRHIQHRRYAEPSMDSLFGKRQVTGTTLIKTVTHTVVATVPSPVSISAPGSATGLLVAPPLAYERLSTSNPQPTAGWTPPEGVRVLVGPPNTSSQVPSSTGSATNPAPTFSRTAPSGPIMAAYYPDWAQGTLLPEQVDFDRFDWVDFAFALPNADFGLYFTQDNSEDLLERLVKAAHAKGKSVKLSIGGWTGSKHFSQAVSTDPNRKKFAQNFLEVYNKFGLDGVDIDWEYPGTQGDNGNAISSQDSENYLSFLKVLRATLPLEAVITAATQVWPFSGPDGTPMSDVSEFAKYLDWILLMNYDVWGSSSNPGPNAPLSDGCKNSSQPLANAEAAVKSWHQAGFPLHKLTLGVPSYGYISKSEATHLSGRRRADFVTVKNDDGGTSNGQVQFNGLITQGALKKENGAYVGAGGFERHWDTCSSTPWLKSRLSGQIITYDDPKSLHLKGAFAKTAGIKGVNMFDAHGDTSAWELVDAVRKGLGVTS